MINEKFLDRNMQPVDEDEAAFISVLKKDDITGEPIESLLYRIYDIVCDCEAGAGELGKGNVARNEFGQWMGGTGGTGLSSTQKSWYNTAVKKVNAALKSGKIERPQHQTHINALKEELRHAALRRKQNIELIKLDHQSIYSNLEDQKGAKRLTGVAMKDAKREARKQIILRRDALDTELELPGYMPDFEPTQKIEPHVYRTVPVNIMTKDVYPSEKWTTPINPISLDQQITVIEKVANKNVDVLGDVKIIIVDAAMIGGGKGFTDPRNPNTIYIPRYESSENQNPAVEDNLIVFATALAVDNPRMKNPTFASWLLSLNELTFEDGVERTLMHTKGHLEAFQKVKTNEPSVLSTLLSEYRDHPSMRNRNDEKFDDVMLGEAVAEDYRIMKGEELGQKQARLPNKLCSVSDIENPLNAKERREILKKIFKW